MYILSLVHIPDDILEDCQCMLVSRSTQLVHLIRGIERLVRMAMAGKGSQKLQELSQKQQLGGK